jgi:predicted nuclease of predicted toxin-antitoxin system
MKLLFDENLSPKLPRLIAIHFPESVHVRDCGLKARPDQAVWEYARDNGFVLVSKDGDFYQRSLLLGAPPKLIWLCLGNCTRNQLLSLLLEHEKDIRSFERASESVLLLS